MSQTRHCLVFLCLLSAASAAWGDTAHDVLMGNGTAGPYPLSWKQIVPNTDAVQVNALAQTRLVDYVIDPDAGTVTFTHPLPAQSAAEVRYDYDPGHAIHTGANLAIPLSLDLTHSAHGSLSLDAMYKRDGASPDTDPGTLAVGLGGGWQNARTQLTTRLLFAPALDSDSKSPPSSDSLARTGMAVSGATQASRVARFSFGFSRVGADMGQTASDNGWQAGAETLTLGSSLTPSRQVAASVNYSQSDPLSHDQRRTDALAAGLTITPAQSLQLQTHWTEATAGGVTTETDDLSVAAQPSKTLSLQADAGQAGGQAGTTQTADLKINAQPTAATQVAASIATQDAPGTASDSQAINLAAQVAPSKVVTVSAGAAQTRQGDVDAAQQQVSLAVTPLAQIQLHTGLTLRQTDQFQTTAATFGGALQPASFVQFSGAYTSRNAPMADTAAADTLDSSAAQVALAPFRGLKFTGHYAQNPDDGGALQRLARRGVGLETSIGALSLSGGYDWSRQYDTPTVGTTLNLGVGLRFSRALQVTGGYQQTLVGVGDAPTGANVYTVGLTHNLGDRFNLSMNGTVQQPTGQTTAATPDYTASANLGMKF